MRRADEGRAQEGKDKRGRSSWGGDGEREWRHPPATPSRDELGQAAWPPADPLAKCINLDRAHRDDGGQWGSLLGGSRSL